MKMNLTNVEESVNLDSFEKNGEWEIYKTKAVRNEIKTSSAKEKFVLFVLTSLEIVDNFSKSL